MEKKTETPFRARICIGSCELLSAWAASCPKCGQRFSLLWPFWVLHIPLHRVVDLRCPFCQHSTTCVSTATCTRPTSCTRSGGILSMIGAQLYVTIYDISAIFTASSLRCWPWPHWYVPQYLNVPLRALQPSSLTQRHTYSQFQSF